LSSCALPGTAASWIAPPGEPTPAGRAKRVRTSSAGKRGPGTEKTTREGTAVSATDKAKNKVEETKGKAKETVGKAVGNESLEAKGKAEQAKGNVKQAGEKIKDAGKGLKP